MVLGHDTTLGHRTKDVEISEDINFSTLLLSVNTFKGLKTCGFNKPSPIQLHGIPLGKCGFDLLLEAKSGTGKTGVFAVISLEKLNLVKGLQVLILAPTREIAVQICDVIKQIGQYFVGLGVEVVMGGTPLQDDILKFRNRNVHILVASPGRVRHLIEANYIDVTAVRLLVLDEADKLMEKSFQTDVNYIFTALPTRKQVIMSSATYPSEARTFINKYVRNSQHICPDSTSILLGISQKVVSVKSDSNIVRQTQLRFEALINILTKIQFKQCLIFCNYQVRISELHKLLTKENWPAEKLYGQQQQVDRLDALKTLQEYKCRILISTDLAARGIDASNVDLVINFEPPFEWQTYLHRIGRAGRFGSYGLAISIVCEGKEENRFKKNIKLLSDQLELLDLWSGEKYFTDICDTSDKADLKNEQSCISIEEHEELPQETVTPEKVNQNNVSLNKNEICDSKIEDFNKLCSSFQNFSDDTLISFTDLLQSYSSNLEEPNTFDSDYHCIPMNEIRKGKIRDISKNSKKSPININSTNSENNNEHLEIKIICGDKNDYNHNYAPSLTSCESKNIVHNNSQRKHTLDNVNFSDDDGTKALLMAGLPTAFGRAKYSTTNRKSYKRGYNTCDTRPVNVTDSRNYKYSHTHVMKSDSKTEVNQQSNPEYVPSRFSYNNKLHNPQGSKLKHRDYDNIDCKESANCTNESEFGSNEETSGESESETDVCTSEGSDSESDNESANINPAYNIWYNQLKRNVNQLEQMVYIEELSKLSNNILL